jgi:hypothetical protein
VHDIAKPCEFQLVKKTTIYFARQSNNNLNQKIQRTYWRSGIGRISSESTIGQPVHPMMLVVDDDDDDEEEDDESEVADELIQALHWEASLFTKYNLT